MTGTLVLLHSYLVAAAAAELEILEGTAKALAAAAAEIPGD